MVIIIVLKPDLRESQVTWWKGQLEIALEPG